MLGRYGMTPAKAMDRILACMAVLAKHGCAPTLPTPGRVVERYPQFVRRLQDAGAEIAVHSYDHVDLAALAPAEASQQLVHAAEVFGAHGVEVRGFRCPYLSCTDELLDALPRGLFEYSSNKPIRWDVIATTRNHSAAGNTEVLERLYQPLPAHCTVCAPSGRSSLVELPVCLPDDLELHDGWQLDPEGVAQAWIQVLQRSHQRGELFDLLFHPELADLCQEPLAAVLREARRLDPLVWIARLCDVSDWWREKAGFGVTTSHTSTGLCISFHCSHRATILARGLNASDSGVSWNGAYRRFMGRELLVPSGCRPFVGLSEHTPPSTIAFLREQGYVVDDSDEARDCSLYLEAATLTGLKNEAELVDYIEKSSDPLVRYWRWPDGAQSALCITGDLDALTLLDYLSRLSVR